MEIYDLAVIGGGTAGLMAAQVAAAAGARVCLIERDRTGGDCLWTGCVPSKSLLASAAAAQTMRTADRVGIAPSEPQIDRGRLIEHVRDAQRRLAPQDSPARLRGMGIDVVEGQARFTGLHQLAVDGDRLDFRGAVIATGSTPVVPSGLEGVGALTTDTVWDAIASLPERVAVVGGGPTGCELAQALGRLDHAVTIFESGDRLLPGLDPEAGASVAERLRAEGVRVLTETRVTTATRDGAIRLGPPVPESGSRFDALVLAAGRRPVTDGLGLSAAGVGTTPSGAVAVDATLRTSARGIFAAGDVVEGPDLTHLAAHHGITAATNALFLLRRRVERRAVPLVVYTDPEVAHVGATAARARSVRPDDVEVTDLTLDRVDRAVTDARTDGWIRLVSIRGTLVGTTIVAPNAGEIITHPADVIRRRGDADDLAATLHPYPTYSMAVYRSSAARRIGSLTGGMGGEISRRILDLLRKASEVRRAFG